MDGLFQIVGIGLILGIMGVMIAEIVGIGVALPIAVAVFAILFFLMIKAKIGGDPHNLY